MKHITVRPAKNSLREIKTWNGSSGKVLCQVTEYRDGTLKVYFPESAREEKEMLAEKWADPKGKKYPAMIDEQSQNIDLSDYVHEMVDLGVASTQWEIKKGNKDISSKHSALLDELESMSEEDIEAFLEDNSWEIDLQYFLIGSVASVS